MGWGDGGGGDSSGKPAAGGHRSAESLPSQSPLKISPFLFSFSDRSYRFQMRHGISFQCNHREATIINVIQEDGSIAL